MEEFTSVEVIKYMQKEIGKQGKFLHRIDERTECIMDRLDIMEKRFDIMDKKYLTHAAFSPYKKLIWIIMGIIISGAITGILFYPWGGI